MAGAFAITGITDPENRGSRQAAAALRVCFVSGEMVSRYLSETPCKDCGGPVSTASRSGRCRQCHMRKVALSRRRGHHYESDAVAKRCPVCDCTISDTATWCQDHAPKPTGADHPTWKGGLPTCQKCGRTLYRLTKSGLCQACGKGRLGRMREDGVSDNTGRQRAIRAHSLKGHICEDCGDVPARTRHHRDENTGNNEASNIAFLCYKCHKAHHPQSYATPAQDAVLAAWPKGQRDVRAGDFKVLGKQYCNIAHTLKAMAQNGRVERVSWGLYRRP